MSDGDSEIQLVYEPGFGSMGTAKENVMVEQPMALYSLSEKTKKYFQELAIRQGLEAEPVEALCILDPKNQEDLSNQISFALSSAGDTLLDQDSFPKVVKKNPLDKHNSYRLSQYSPVATIKMSASTIHRETDIRFPSDVLVFFRTSGATDPDYRRARNMIREKANETLELFKIPDRIPDFSSTGTRREV